MKIEPQQMPGVELLLTFPVFTYSSFPSSSFMGLQLTGQNILYRTTKACEHQAL